MVFSYLHFQVGTWNVIIKRLHAVSTFVLWILRFDNADAGENVTENWFPFKPFLDYSNFLTLLKVGKLSLSWRKSTSSQA